MKHSIKLLCVLLLIATGCSNDLATRCIMKEAVVAYAGPTQSFKRKFTHDGNHYVQFKDYFYDSNVGDFRSDPDYTVSITYTNDRVSHVVKYYNESSYSITQDMTYSISKGVTTVSIHEVIVSGGVVGSDRNFNQYVYENPHDTTYLSKNEIDQAVLLQFEHGNLKKVGFQSPTGTYAAYDTTWTFDIVYNYDNLPNLTADYVFQDLITYTTNYGYSANNVIETVIDPDGAHQSIKQTFERTIDKQLAKYTYEPTTRNITFRYDCK